MVDFGLVLWHEIASPENSLDYSSVVRSYPSEYHSTKCFCEQADHRPALSVPERCMLMETDEH